MKYSKVVTKNGWSTPTGKQNNKSPDRRNKKEIPDIAGVEEDDIKEYLVRGLSVKNFRTHRDLEGSVKRYCKERKVETTYQRVITFKNNKKTVGCKINIKAKEKSKIFQNDFWPKGVSVREWFDRKPNDRDRFFDSSDDSDEHRSK